MTTGSKFNSSRMPGYRIRRARTATSQRSRLSMLAIYRGSSPELCAFRSFSGGTIGPRTFDRRGRLAVVIAINIASSLPVFLPLLPTGLDGNVNPP
jgi:hypothetical protein